MIRLYWYQTGKSLDIPRRSTEHNWIDVNPQYIVQVSPHTYKPEKYVSVVLSTGKTYIVSKEYYEELSL